MPAHLYDTCPARLQRNSFQRLSPRRGGPEFIHGNHHWLKYHRRLSTRVLIQLIQPTGRLNASSTKNQSRTTWPWTWVILGGVQCEFLTKLRGTILLEYETKRKENVKVSRWNPEDLIILTPRVLTPGFSYPYYVGVFQPCFGSVSQITEECIKLWISLFWKIIVSIFEANASSPPCVDPAIVQYTMQTVSIISYSGVTPFKTTKKMPKHRYPSEKCHALGSWLHVTVPFSKLLITFWEPGTRNCLCFQATSGLVKHCCDD